jgi:hypothetical protein
VGDIQFVEPAAPGHTFLPSSVGELSFLGTGRPSASFVSLQVVVAKGFDNTSFPLVRSIR